MKSKTTKALLLTLCAVLLIAGSVLGTLAYLSDRDKVVNTFTVGDVQIKLDEADVDEDGNPVDSDNDGEADRTEEGNQYHLVPGQTYPKDPTVTVEAGSEPSYVRMLVTINCASQLKAIFGDDFLPQNYVDGWDEEKWACVGVAEDTEANTLTYEFRYHSIVGPNGTDTKLEPLFTHFTLPGQVTGDQLATIAALEIDVEGHAIQAATFADADAAWDAFDAQYNTQNP